MLTLGVLEPESSEGAESALTSEAELTELALSELPPLAPLARATLNVVNPGAA